MAADNPVMRPVLSVEGYSLSYRTGHRGDLVPALVDISLSVARGEVLGLVGESGSGKSSLANAIMRYLPQGAQESGGAIRLDGQDLCTMTRRQISHIRGRRIAMVFQDPSTSLNPTLTLGEQVSETLVRHKGLSWNEARAQAEHLMERVALKEPRKMMARYPHEASGGEKQRVILAGVLGAEPEAILFDEPTTALDIITARQILELFGELQRETGVASLYISHDLALVSRIADRVAVIHRGRIVEEDPAREVFRNPRDDYTRQLIASVPRPEKRLAPPLEESRLEPLLKLENMTVRYGQASFWKRLGGAGPELTVGARNIGFDVRPSEIVGVVGESGSGKSTIARALVGINPFEGRITLGGRSIPTPDAMDRDYRRAVQIIFQHPDSSLNPRRRIDEILARPLRLYGLSEGRTEAETIGDLLEQVQLPRDFAKRYPHELSGGQKQRIAIARAFAARPKLVICDEITSSLDVSVQAQIIELLLELREQFGTAYLFITHDINLIRQIAHRVAVMLRGDLIEVRAAGELGQPTNQDYTKALIDAVPTPVG
ncbi:ABC transporter ATP-binding protein [Chelativorans sp. AA-79]|uniref:dipeptide ABC transporter ATP-binding protein n=1 Tax=Chelativorans sp. AA-79 TaxID=3028735 RepID=UPI0023FA2A8C|nr:ABC transporter ATP-binding protein [Chelativorans sp. AA-79]WEX09679.1 ABC transporter ATP-binding protein [Chelativorans sp. AA-79]